jgi:hypothetical protein
VRSRSLELGERYVGVLTDGADWRAYSLRNDRLVNVASFGVSASQPDVDALLVWLEGVLATSQGLRPTPTAGPRQSAGLTGWSWSKPGPAAVIIPIPVAAHPAAAAAPAPRRPPAPDQCRSLLDHLTQALCIIR